MVSGEYREMSDAMKVHGTLHAARTCLLVAILADMEGLAEKEIYALMIAAVIHDLGRKSDSIDARHGGRSIEEAKKLDKESIRSVASFHSRGDRTFANNPNKRLIGLLKDADALDRTRTRDLDPSYLRAASSQALIDDAEELYKWTLNIFER